MGDDCGGRDTGAVASAVGVRQLDGDTVGSRGPGGGVAGEGEHEGVLAPEEAVAADAAGRAPLGGVLGIRRHLEGAALGARQGTRRAGGGDDDTVARRVGDAEEQRPAPRRRA